IARDFSLKTGEIVNTAYRIPYRIEDGKTLFDIIESALDITLQQTGKRYVLYDDFGKLTLQSTETMTVPIWIDETAGEGLSFSSSIDRETYNKIKFLHEDGRKGVRNIYQKEDRTTQKKWGILQHFSHISGEVNGSQEASSTLRLSNKKARTLSLSKVCGDVHVRAGSTLSVKLIFGQEKVEQKMTVASVRHLFSAEEHRMDLTLEGGSFDG
ncbi:MAG: hydrolase, partial [Oscillospiraceae bacterium]